MTVPSKISVVSPVYRAKRLVPELVNRIYLATSPICSELEIVLVDDGCPEGSWETIVELCVTFPCLIGVKLSRNFGQHHAITAGLDVATGDWIVVMDCDLQDQPEEIPLLLTEALKGNDIVLARRFSRQDALLKRYFSKLFYRSLGYLTGSEQDETVANFGIYSRKVIDQIKSMRESIRYFPTMIKWVGFKVGKVNVRHAARTEGKTSYNFRRMLSLALDIILAFSDKPIMLTIRLGLLISSVAVIMSLYTMFRWASGGLKVIGYASLITSIWLLSGFIILTLGVIGLYLGKTFEGVKGRPLYIIDKKTND